MTDSDDDWFEKDFNDIDIRKIKASTEEPTENNISASSLQNKGVPKYLVDSDYGGNYVLPTHKSHLQTSQQKTNVRAAKGFTQTLSFKKLSFISELTPLNVFLEVTQPDCGFWQCFKEDLKDDYAILLIKVLHKLCTLPLEEFKREFLTFFVNSETVLNGLGGLFKRIFTDTLPKSKKSIFQINAFEVCQELVYVFRAVVRHRLSTGRVTKCVKELTMQLKKTGSRYASIRREAELLNESLENIENIQRIEIYPEIEELTTISEVELKPNIIEGKFESIQDYLSIHRSLLREDFMIPLRESISELKKSESVDNKVYKKVRILLNDVITSNTRKGWFVDLKPDQRQTSNNAADVLDHNWVNPKKLMYGSLLCFTTNTNFDNLILALVTNRDIQRGYIQVEILKIYNIGKIFNIDLIMLESEVYFEPYHYVYRVLDNLDENTFPMVDYVVGVTKEHHPPDYLNSANPQMYEYKKHRFNPLDYSSYPPEKLLSLDAMQYKAYQHALSNKFTLIQGPPGTGKTHIGLEIISTLLTNADAQILVICYTNHALDQFLSGILKTTDDIVRMGNQSKHDQLDKYNIKQMMDVANSDRRLKSCYYNTKQEHMLKSQDFEKLQAEFDGSQESYEQMLNIQEELRKISRKLDELKQICDYNFIKDKKVIGMTTTCAARCHLMLQLLKTPIVIVEEAAEVLESHIIAALTLETQHLILIGDHLQLRPTTSVYKLSKKYKMDISLFERMVNNELNCVCLTTQHRMREEIADLIRPIIYKNLYDHENVRSYERVRGVKKSLFFITHNFVESKLKDETTKRNIHEAQFMCAFANYLLMQKYKSEDIVLLTTYNGQLITLINERKQYQSLQNVRVTVVDNFQGEESKIVLLSLVRNNTENRIGYLGMQNRISVALSRAREGLFIIGNIEFMAKNNLIWNRIKAKLEENEAIEESLPLQCIRHNVVMKMKTAADFEQVKFGGCQKICDFALPCGHHCGYMCHWNGFEHFANCNCPSSISTTAQAL